MPVSFRESRCVIVLTLGNQLAIFDLKGNASGNHRRQFALRPLHFNCRIRDVELHVFRYLDWFLAYS